MATPPTLPTNGTPKDELLRGYLFAFRAVENARSALAATAPRSCDYSPDDFRKATDEHVARMARLKAIRAEIDDIIEALQGA